MKTAKGLHHISVVAGDPQQNAGFYVKSMGMRMVKKTVNQDDPFRYHLFYGNETGSPGSGLTFFPWPEAVQGKPGTGEAVAVSLAVPSDSIEYWAKRFGEQDTDFEGPFERYKKQVIRFKDPDRLQLELVFDENLEQLPAWPGGPVPKKYGIRGFWGTTLRLNRVAPTASILEDVLGFEQKESAENRTLFKTGADIGSSVIIEKTDPEYGQNGRGIVHHVAFRAEDEEELEQMRQKVLELNLHPTEIIDRYFFKSVYFREPGGVLFEMATDGPGYTVNEQADLLGQKLVLPPWLENKREMIEKRLPEIRL